MCAHVRKRDRCWEAAACRKKQTHLVKVILTHFQYFVATAVMEEWGVRKTSPRTWGLPGHKIGLREHGLKKEHCN